MLHLLKRHPLPVTAFFSRALVLTYAFPPQVLQPLLPERLVLDTWLDTCRDPSQEWGFLAIALVETRRLRPSFLPAAMGCDFFLSGYRIFARLEGARSLRGLRILHSETNRRLMVCAGNLLTHYHYALCRAAIEPRHGGIRWTVRPPHGKPDHADPNLDVIAHLAEEPAALPPGSPFASIAEARRFAGPLPYTFNYEPETQSVIAVRAVRQKWNPQPVNVEVRRCAFLEQEPFRQCAPVLASAFYLQDVPYMWQRGRRVA
jgi:hypothetical protein